MFGWSRPTVHPRHFAASAGLMLTGVQGTDGERNKVEIDEGLFDTSQL